MKIATLVVLSMLAFGPCVKADSTYTFQNFAVPVATFTETFTEARAINDSGQIVGNYFSETQAGQQGFSYQSGNFTTLDFPGATDTNITGLNNLGQVVGVYYFPQGPFHNFIYSSGTFTSFDVPGGGGVLGINDLGEMVGSGHADQGLSGFLYNKGTVTTIAFPGAFRTTARGINDSGEITGGYSTSNNFGQHGFLYDGKEYVTIDFPGSIDTIAWGINNLGQIVGEYENQLDITRGFLYSDGTFTTIDFPGAWIETVPLGINNSADIVGFEVPVSCSTSSFHCAFLATPTPEPTTLLLLGTGLLVLVGFSLKRFTA